MPEDNQQFIFNTDELSLIKNTFAENDRLLYTVRKVFLQFPLSKEEKVLLKTAMTPEVLQLLKKRILPELSAEYPLGQIPSLMTTLMDQIKVKSVEEMEIQFDSKELQTLYLEQCFRELETGEDEGEEAISLAELGKLTNKSSSEQMVDMTAYLFLLGYIDPMLIMIRAMAGSKDETEDQQKKRMTRNSNK